MRQKIYICEIVNSIILKYQIKAEKNVETLCLGRGQM